MSKEIYARAPVQFVSFVAGFPLSPALQAPGGKEAVYERLREWFPLLEALHAAQIELPVGPGPVIRAPTDAQGGPRQLRMTSRDRRNSVTLGPRMAKFDSTDHESFERMEDVLRLVIEAVDEVAAPAGLIEVSLQYVDEIRHPDAAAPGDWRRFVHDALAGPDKLLGLEADRTSGAALYRLSEQHQLQIGYGAARGGFVVDPSGPLRVDQHEDGPFFRLNFESEWNAPEDAVPAFDVEPVIEIARELHSSISGAFEQIIKPELREYFRGDDNGSAR